jgi:SAP domain-containing protein
MVSTGKNSPSVPVIPDEPNLVNPPATNWSAVQAQSRLRKAMTVAEFDNGYWYATEIKDFARAIGIPHTSRLRKDELEASIKLFLRTGRIALPTQRNLTNSGRRDIETGLSLRLPVVNYTSNRATKDFIVGEAKKLVPGLREKSGARYRLNRWREEQLTNGVAISYGDVVRQYAKLCQTKKPFKQIPVGRFINFLSNFLKSEKDATRSQALTAWKQLKKADVAKTYRAWKRISAR